MTDHSARAAPVLYHRLAAAYDLSTAWLEPYRRRTISQLRLRPGDVVLDVGCGTGLSFRQIQAGIGPQGRLVGIEPSRLMLDHARTRVEGAGWDNVTLLEADAESATIPGPVDAVLFAFAHDVLQSPKALANVLGQLHPGGRVAAAGPKWAPLAPPLNLLVWQVASQYVTTFEGFGRPWAELERALSGLCVEEACFGCVYLAWGRVARVAGGPDPGDTGMVTSQAHQPAATAPPAPPWRIDVGDLPAHTGRDLGYGPWHDITQRDVSRYAALTGDEQWIHVDPERAAGGPFGATVAHGFYTLGRFTGLLREILTVERVKTTLNYGVNRVRFPAPALVGGRLRMGLTIDHVERLADSVQVVYGAVFELQGQAKPVCVAEVVFRYYPDDRRTAG